MPVIAMQPRPLRPRVPLVVDVQRCVRYRGEFSLRNRFRIGKSIVSNSPLAYRVYLCPLSHYEAWLETIGRQIQLDGMIEWADGKLTPEFMDFWTCEDIAPHATISEVLHYAFLQRRADERLDDFLNATVRLVYLNQRNRVLGKINALINLD